MSKNKKTIAFIYNVRRHYPDPKNKSTFYEADFDDPEAIRMYIYHLEKCGYNVIPVEADEKAFFKLYRYRKSIDMAFNIAEGIRGVDRESYIPAILEMLSIPHIGSSVGSQSILHHKGRLKEFLHGRGISSLPGQVFISKNDKLDANLKFPLIVKPVAEGSSSGVTNKSVVNDLTELSDRVKNIVDFFKQPALVEPFLDGIELSVGLLGNPPRVLPIIESDHSKLPTGYLPLDSYEVKWLFEVEMENNPEASNFVCPARISNQLKIKVEQLCLDLWNALEIKDWGRVDVRCDRDNNPYILEINSPPGCTPPEVSTSSYFPYAARVAGIDYDELLQTIIESALKRYRDAT